MFNFQEVTLPVLTRLQIGRWNGSKEKKVKVLFKPIGSMYAIYGNIYHQYTPNVSIYNIYTIHGSYKSTFMKFWCTCFITSRGFPTWEPEGQRAGQGKTPRSFQILPCGNLRTSSVSPKWRWDPVALPMGAVLGLGILGIWSGRTKEDGDITWWRTSHESLVGKFTPVIYMGFL